MSDFYRIIFISKEKKYCHYDKADLFLLYKNNKKIGVFNNLKLALRDLEKNIDSGCKDIDFLKNHLGILENKRSHFKTTSIIFSDTHGLKIEQKLNIEQRNLKLVTFPLGKRSL
jgi:hypothetical protein